MGTKMPNFALWFIVVIIAIGWLSTCSENNPPTTNTIPAATIPVPTDEPLPENENKKPLTKSETLIGRAIIYLMIALVLYLFFRGAKFLFVHS